MIGVINQFKAAVMREENQQVVKETATMGYPWWVSSAFRVVLMLIKYSPGIALLR